MSERDHESYRAMCRGAGIQSKSSSSFGSGGKAMSGLDLVTVIENQLPGANRKAVRGLAACLIEIYDNAGSQSGRIHEDLTRLSMEIAGNPEYRALLKPQVPAILEGK